MRQRERALVVGTVDEARGQPLTCQLASTLLVIDNVALVALVIVQMRAHLADGVLPELVVHAVELLDAVHFLLQVLLQVHALVHEALAEQLVLRNEVGEQCEAPFDHLLATLQERLVLITQLLLFLDATELNLIKVQLRDDFEDLGCVAARLIKHPGAINNEVSVVMAGVSVFAEDLAVIDVSHLPREHPDRVFAVAINVL